MKTEHMSQLGISGMVILLISMIYFNVIMDDIEWLQYETPPPLELLIMVGGGLGGMVLINAMINGWVRGFRQATRKDRG